jgi:hypothetical protein
MPPPPVLSALEDYSRLDVLVALSNWTGAGSDLVAGTGSETPAQLLLALVREMAGTQDWQVKMEALADDAAGVTAGLFVVVPADSSPDASTVASRLADLAAQYA